MSVRVETCSPGGLLAGTAVEVVGVEDAPDGALRVFIVHRAEGRYVVVGPEFPDEQDALRRGWANTHARLLIPTPRADQVFREVRP